MIKVKLTAAEVINLLYTHILSKLEGICGFDIAIIHSGNDPSFIKVSVDNPDFDWREEGEVRHLQPRVIDLYYNFEDVNADNAVPELETTFTELQKIAGKWIDKWTGNEEKRKKDLEEKAPETAESDNNLPF